MKTNLEVSLIKAENTTEEKWEVTRDKIEEFADDLEKRIDKAMD